MLPILIFAGLTIAQSSGEAQSSQTFVSAPELHAPVLSVNKSGAQLANGLLLMTSQEYGPLLMTDFGDLIWNGPSGHATNLFVQYLDDDPVLTYWIGTGSNLEHGYGQVNILDTNYDQIYTICPNLTLTTTMGQSTGCGLDLHESLLTTRGTIICTAVNVTTADLTSVGGPQVGWVYDNLFLEINIKTNDILFVWSALASGIPINSTKQALSSAGTSQSNPFDWFHMNSVTTLNDGYLANSRHAWSSYALDSNGRVKWTLEGSNGGDFALPTVANFSWQHHVRVEKETSSSLSLHLYNDMNASGDIPSNGLLLYLDLENYKVTLKSLYMDPTQKIASTSQGSYQQLSNDNVLLGYGNQDYFKEFSPDGDVVMSISGLSSYRVYRQAWDASPAGYSPNVTAMQGQGWVSWNGDTKTTKWAIYAGSSNDSLSLVAEVARIGFQTQFNLSSSAAWVQVGAFAGELHLKNSSVVAVSG
ncbi:hypothetical protein GGP41_005358 [Bipolaris sorokiniana]|uniref:ASST-domain-containing protein n=2 Tax=Cochliobolus sativus TaxID=45130 RepID=A0A8H5ZG97_COCSA|nr:uncharacterized protein COCSADRAFT_351655 [Bipolaris sorokiniana ND90Pr]EMD67030.1 hypothetical protein COCSADRAFT_351655 [Bipolaris sorokiniana ND90Pr]KAF5849893.1 hypothetical protein GGP41_005358 [Bipolaris sorokiniana]